jgi:hypothetical protein
VLRQIESQYPDIQFNWATVREGQQLIETSAEPRRRRPRREDEATPVAAPPPVVAVAPPPAPATPPAPRIAIPAAIEGETPDERIAFLSHWHPIIRERIPQRTSEPGRQEALNALADRLNPANWTDADEITAGLQQAAEALERLSHVFSKRRRRGRRRPKEPRSTDSAPSGS